MLVCSASKGTSGVQRAWCCYVFGAQSQFSGSRVPEQQAKERELTVKRSQQVLMELLDRCDVVKGFPNVGMLWQELCVRQLPGDLVREMEQSCGAQ